MKRSVIFSAVVVLYMVGLLACGKDTSAPKGAPAGGSSQSPQAIQLPQMTPEQTNSKIIERVAGIKTASNFQGQNVFETPAGSKKEEVIASDRITMDEAYALATAPEAIPLNKLPKAKVTLKPFYNGWYTYDDRDYQWQVANFGGFFISDEKTIKKIVAFMITQPKIALKYAGQAFVLFTVPTSVGGIRVDQYNDSCKASNFAAAVSVTKRLQRLAKDFHGLEHMPDDFLEKDFRLNSSGCDTTL